MRPVVPTQDDGPSPDIAILEGEDVVHGRPAERVDGLVVVADDRDVAMLLGEDRDEFGLGAVRVLELVDEDVPEPSGDRGSRLGRGPHEVQGQRDLVAEVDGPVLRHQPLVGRVGAGQLALARGPFERRHGVIGGPRVGVAGSGGVGHEPCLGGDPVGECLVVGWADVLVLATAEEGGQGGQEAGRIAERPVGVELELEQVLPQEDHHLGTGQDAHVGRQAELQGVLADQPVAEGMERRDRRVRVPVGHELVHADRHLLGGLVGERERQDLRRPGASGGDEPGDPTRDDLGLAGAGAGHDQHRPVAVGDRAKLIGVEPAEQGGHPVRGWWGGCRRHDGHEVAPGGQLVEGRRLASRSGAGSGPGHGLDGRRARLWGPCR